MSQSFPEKIGKYIIRKRLGRGGMGVLYVAYDSILHRDVALKVMSSAIGDDPKQKIRFEREARSIAQLSHPNIVTIHDLGYDKNGYPYLAMELLKGQDLERMIRTDPPAFEKKLEIVGQICDGLAHAHGHGIVHRDVKPANVFITDEGVVKLVDFGLARFTTSDSRTLAIVGTRHYISPEQIRAEPVDGRADIFSVGVILYRLVSGTMPFADEEDGLDVVFYNTVHGEPRPLTLLDDSDDVELERIVLKAIAKDLDERYQSAAELASDVRAVRQRRSSFSGAAPPPTERRSGLDVDSAAREASLAIDGRDFARAKTVIATGRERDPSNPIWQELESRLTQAESTALGAEASDAISQKDFDRAKTLISRGVGLTPSDSRWAELENEISTAKRRVFLARAAGVAALLAVVAGGAILLPPLFSTEASDEGSTIGSGTTVSTPTASISTTSVPTTTIAEPATTTSATTSVGVPPHAQAESIADEAEIALASENFDAAQALIARGRRLHADSPRWGELESRLETKRKEREESVRRTRAVDEHLKQAAELMASEDYDAAIAAYDRVLALDDLNQLAIRGKNEAVLLKNRTRESLETGQGLRITQEELVWRPQSQDEGPSGFKPEGVKGQRVTADVPAPGSVDIELKPDEIRPGDPFVLRVRFYNDMNRPIHVESVEVVWGLEGKKTGQGQLIEPRIGLLAPKATTVLHEVSGTWRDDQRSGSVTATVNFPRGGQLIRTIRW